MPGQVLEQDEAGRMLDMALLPQVSLRFLSRECIAMLDDVGAARLAFSLSCSSSMSLSDVNELSDDARCGVRDWIPAKS